MIMFCLPYGNMRSIDLPQVKYFIVAEVSYVNLLRWKI